MESTNDIFRRINAIRYVAPLHSQFKLQKDEEITYLEENQQHIKYRLTY